MFLDYFGETHTFQTFDDKMVNKKLIKQLHGRIKNHFHELAELNQKGGVYILQLMKLICLVDLQAILKKLDLYL